MTRQEERADRVVDWEWSDGPTGRREWFVARIATAIFEAEREAAERMREQCAAAIEQHASDHAWLYAAGAEAVRVIRSQALEGGS